MVVTITLSPTVDYSAEVDELVPDRKLRADVSAFHPGGGGLNVSRVLRDLGVGATAVVAVGGIGGRIVVEGLRRGAIPFVEVETEGSTRWSEIVRDRARRREYRLIGAPVALLPDEVERCLDLVAGRAGPAGPAGAIVLSGRTPPGVDETFLPRLAATARRVGVPLVVDSSGPSLVAAVAAGADLIKPSRRELVALAREAGLGSGDDVVAACQAVRRRGVGAVVCSRGAAGAVVVGEGIEALVVPPAIRVASTVGAGDALVAGIVAAQAEGRSLLDATRFGVAVATATCLTAAGAPARPRDIDRLAREVATRSPWPGPDPRATLDATDPVEGARSAR